MRIAIYGAGSLGTVLGAYLTKNGVSVDLVNHNGAHVEALKKSGGFDQKAQIYAFNLAKDTALKQLSDETKNYITNNYGNLEEWLKTQIEASINLLKN